MDDAEIAYDERGLVPCIVQDWRTGEVLTLAYMNEEALTRTRETGEVHFFSRSRKELWHKGATSGNTQAVKAIRYDCDADARAGAGRAGRPGLSHRRALLLSQRRHSTPERPTRRSGARAHDRRAGATKPDGSYTVKLLADPRLAAPRSRRRPRRWSAPHGRSPMSAWPRRPPT